MRIALLTFLLVTPLVPRGQSAPPISTLMFNLSPDSDGAKTLISWTFSGPIKDSFAVSAGIWGGIGSMFPGAFNPSTTSTQTFEISNAGILSDLTASTSVPVTQIQLGIGPNGFIALRWGGTEYATSGFSDTGRNIRYTPGTDSYVIDLPFTSFNAGIYTSTGGNVQGDMNFSATIVPEPSALSLLAVGLGGLVAWRRVRRSTV